MDKNICTHPENCVASKTNENINASKKHKSMGKAKTHFFMQKNAHSDALSNGVGQQGHTVPSVAKNAHSDALLNKVDQRDPKCENRRDMPVSALFFLSPSGRVYLHVTVVLLLSHRFLLAQPYHWLKELDCLESWPGARPPFSVP